MGKKIFSDNGFNVHGKILPYDEFKIMSDKKDGFKINDEFLKPLLEIAEPLLTTDFPSAYLSEYMDFSKSGSRSMYHKKFFPRRENLLHLAFAEYAENKGRFTNKLADLVWLVLEETTWVIPAHNRKQAVPYTFNDNHKVDFLDLFAATTSANLAIVYYLTKDKFDEISPLINERILYELKRRMIEPFLDPILQRTTEFWTGVNGNKLNNWAPWIVSNVLTVTALTVKDTALREAVAAFAMQILDNFTNGYLSDGGCEEGPGYWDGAGGALFDCCELLYDMTGGYVNVYNDELLRNMGEYKIKVNVHGNRFLNFADCPAKLEPDLNLIYEWGKACNSEMMMTYALDNLNGEVPPYKVGTSHLFRFFRFMTCEKHPKAKYVAPTKFWLDGIIIAGARETSDTEKGLYVALKGGNNGESHNHNDIGNIIVYADNQPIFLDAGSGKYTARTFGPDRYTIWAMSSHHHNVPTINGIDQVQGGNQRSTNHVYDEKTGKLTMSLKYAYPSEANIEEYTRSAVLENSRITIEDNVELKENGNIIFNYLVNEEPKNITENSFVLHGRTIEFDPSLEFNYEVVDRSWPETAGYAKVWDAKELYRIRLSNKKQFINHKYVLTIK